MVLRPLTLARPSSPCPQAAGRFIVGRMKLLVVDDHPIVRDALAALLGQLERDALVLQAGDAEKALALVAAHADLDVVILDIAMPGMNGLRGPAGVARSPPEPPVAV